MFDILDDRERRVLGFVGLPLLLAVVFLLFVALRQKTTYSRAKASLALEQGVLQKKENERDAKKREWQVWEQTLQDIEELRNNNFYADEQGLTQLRSDLQRIFNETRTRVSRVRYNYSRPKKVERIQTVRIAFQTAGSYQDIKKLIHSFEVFPKFLILEKVDFSDVDSLSGSLRLNLTLAGYIYED